MRDKGQGTRDKGQGMRDEGRGKRDVSVIDRFQSFLFMISDFKTIRIILIPKNIASIK